MTSNCRPMLRPDISADRGRRAGASSLATELALASAPTTRSEGYLADRAAVSIAAARKCGSRALAPGARFSDRSSSALHVGPTAERRSPAARVGLVCARVERWELRRRVRCKTCDAHRCPPLPTGSALPFEKVHEHSDSAHLVRQGAVELQDQRGSGVLQLLDHYGPPRRKLRVEPGGGHRLRHVENGAKPRRRCRTHPPEMEVQVEAPVLHPPRPPPAERAGNGTRAQAGEHPREIVDPGPQPLPSRSTVQHGDCHDRHSQHRVPTDRPKQRVGVTHGASRHWAHGACARRSADMCTAPLRCIDPAPHRCHSVVPEVPRARPPRPNPKTRLPRNSKRSARREASVVL